jgi:L,D-peptidoglycan transpeptidase YkuD (ErfK/YbiS/YcfS/YnhG family)
VTKQHLSGVFGLRYIFYRADKIEHKPSQRLTCRKINKNDGWCDDPKDPRYNNHIRLPYSAGHEELWREDDCYDIIVVTTHNSMPVIPNLGSAIFIHIAREGYAPTEGCIALAKEDLLEILKNVVPSTQIIIPNFDKKRKLA